MPNSKQEVITMNGERGYIDRMDGHKYIIYIYEYKDAYVYNREEFDYVKV